MKRLGILARPPVAGQVKTRLSPAMPAALAADLYRALLADTLAAATGAGADECALYWAPSATAAPVFAVPAGFSISEQRGNDLGERLASAFGDLLRGPAECAVVIGADCPDLDAAVIRQAFAALEENDLVLGPARDGGYYLIGLRRPVPALFSGMAWGSERLLEQTLARARGEGLTPTLLPELADLDTPADLVRFVAARSFARPEPGRATEEALRAMGLLPPRA